MAPAVLPAWAGRVARRGVGRAAFVCCAQASAKGVAVGDRVVAINGEDVTKLRHSDVTAKIFACKGELAMTFKSVYEEEVTM